MSSTKDQSKLQISPPHTPRNIPRNHRSRRDRTTIRMENRITSEAPRSLSDSGIHPKHGRRVERERLNICGLLIPPY
eukprot:8260762-Pyramimonas_sp.AAC.1